MSWYAEAFSDRLGDRLLLFDTTGPGLELLRFSPTLIAVEGFEASVRARIEECGSFTHPSFARVRSVTVLDDPHPQLALVSEHAPGERLSAVLRKARQSGARLHPDSAVWLLRSIAPALAALQGQRPGSAHGCLTPDRIVITPTGEAVITEYALGPAVERLNLDRRGLWRDFGVLAGADGVPAMLGPRADVVQLGLITIELLLGRSLRGDDLPSALPALVESACNSPDVARTNLRRWIERAIGLAQPAFADAAEACQGLDVLMPGIAGCWTSALPDAGSPARSQALARRSRLTTLGLSGGEMAPRRALPALPAHRGDPVVVARRLRRVSVTLGAVALAEAAALVFLLTRPPQDVLIPPVGIEAAVRAVAAPEPARAAPIHTVATDPAEATVGSLQPNLPAGTAPVRAVPDAANTPGVVPARDSVIGWIGVQSDVEVRVYANGRLLGSAAQGRFRLPAGEHDITLVNESIGLRSTQPVRVVAGRTAILTPPPR